ncbi:uncharacterized protein LOC119854761 [Dermochelys coriacea]|uniref:uncharacterized protein LOC119854761 n=1 Tax=Dermochelys coriacea TaxID=27794 RepID=UPI0018E8F74C|nr:uncharacterized protein LOC119854761 [Dermochelys coriacea]
MLRAHPHAGAHSGSAPLLLQAGRPRGRRQGVSPAGGSSSALHFASRRRLQASARRHVNRAAERRGPAGGSGRLVLLPCSRSAAGISPPPPCSRERPGRLRLADPSAAALSQRVTFPSPSPALPPPLLSLPSWLEIPTDVSRAREKRRPPRKGGEVANERGAPKAEQLPGCPRGERAAQIAQADAVAQQAWSPFSSPQQLRPPCA